MTILSPHLTEIVPKAGTNTSTRHRIQQPEKPKGGPNNRQLRVIAIYFFGKLYTKNQTAVFEIKYFVISTYKPLQIRKDETQQETKKNATAAAVKRGLVLVPGTSYQGWCYFLICWVYFFCIFVYLLTHIRSLYLVHDGNAKYDYKRTSTTCSGLTYVVYTWYMVETPRTTTNERCCHFNFFIFLFRWVHLQFSS